jgi:hypothetical protein
MMGAEENKMVTHAMVLLALGVDSSTLLSHKSDSRQESLFKVATTLDNDPLVEQGTQRVTDTVICGSFSFLVVDVCKLQ